MIYTLAVFFPWVAFFLRDRIFSAVFSFILWIIFGYNIFAFVFSGGGVFGISLILESFFLWVILTVWCCLVMHGDQRRKEMEQLINAIETNSGKSLHQETHQANKTNGTLANVFIIGLGVLAVFYDMKGKHHSSNNPKSGVEKLKNPSHKN
nr:flagellar biosynthesis protein FlgG [Helicobacter pylori]